MEQYPTINNIIQDVNIYAYDKLDGSNIRVEWTPKSGFVKYGSRHLLIDETHPFLGEAIPIFNNKYAEDLDAIFRKERYQRATAFLEFYGSNSFAGFHVVDEPHTLTLFDVHVYKKGLLPPQQFNKTFANRVETAPLLYQGKANRDFIEQVKQNQLEGMTFEGVVCKAGYDKRQKLVNFKIKSWDWLNKLKQRYGDDESLYKKLI